MIGLAVTFDLGRVHCTPWGTHVNEAAVEWPPSPWRILRALRAVSYTHCDLIGARPKLRDALEKLAAAPPPDYVLPPTTQAHTRHYYPLPAWSPSASDKTSLVVDAFAAVDPDAELQVWWDAQLTIEERAALERAAEAVGYLGRSESVCTMRVVDQMTGEPNASPAVTRPTWATLSRTIELWSAPDRLDALDVSIAELRKDRRLTPDGVHPVLYFVREPPAPSAQSRALEERPTLAHLRMRGGARPPLSDAIEVARVLRAALQRRFDGNVGGGASPIFSGHELDGSVRRDQHQHAHYMVGSDRGAQRADHLWVWAPGGFGDDEMAALAGLRTLRFRGAPETCRVGLVAVGDARRVDMPRLTGPSSVWSSATPFVMPRHQKRRGGRIIDGPESQISRELLFRGFPEPVSIELRRGNWSSFKLTRSGVSRRLAHHAVGAQIQFSEPIRGPIAIGAHSHFGLGRFEPLS